MQNQTQDLKVQRIIRWRETMLTLNDERFFEIMRIYIGEIHTPYNKDKLIEQLSSLFRKTDNKEKLISYLTDFDIKIITAISLIKDPTQEKLTNFFKSEYQLSEIYSELLNLNERLIIYSYKNEEQKIILAINPILEETLNTFINIQKLLPQPEYAEHNFDTPFTLTPQFLAAFISYIYENPDLCKNNTEFKKKDAERLEQIFPNKSNCLHLLINSFINIGLFVQTEKGLSPNYTKLQSFAKLPELKQYAYLASASATRLGREGLKKQSQLLLHIIASVPSEGFTQSAVLRTAFLITNKNTDSTKAPIQGRFSQILQARNQTAIQSEYSPALIDRIVECAIEFGLLFECGKTEKGVLILKRGAPVSNFATEKKGLVNINAGSSITILPGLSLKELLTLVQFVNIKSINTVSEFEITRKSASRAFDKNILPEQILHYLEEYSAYKIPQSLQLNIEEWFTSYSSAMLYNGYVLKVDKKNERVIQNNPKLTPFIQTKLADGIFLLNIPQENDAATILKECGLDFMGTVKSAEKEFDSIDFPLLGDGENFFKDSYTQETDNTLELELAQKARALKSQLHKKLESMELTKQQFECLYNRIERNVIINEDQLNPQTVRHEILEADTMNYNGKIRLIENAIQSEDLIQITMPSEKNPNEKLVYLGQPLMIAKQTSDSLLKLLIAETEEVRMFSISKASKVKIIKTSLFR